MNEVNKMLICQPLCYCFSITELIAHLGCVFLLFSHVSCGQEDHNIPYRWHQKNYDGVRWRQDILFVSISCF